MEINKDLFYSDLLYNREIIYSKNIILFPIKMKNIIEFQQYSYALTIRKNSIFNDKQIIKMEYLDFIKYSYNNLDLASKYDMPILPYCYSFVLQLLQLVCVNSVIKYDIQNLDIYVNDELITSKMFDDIRKIIILQNDIDFDIDEFMNKDTIKALEKAKQFEIKKNKEKSDIEDYIDSLVIALKVSDKYVENLTIRKFWRYIKRINKYNDYTALKTAELVGFVTFKEPINHWMTSIEVEDKYKNLKTSEQEIKNKVG